YASADLLDAARTWALDPHPRQFTLVAKATRARRPRCDGFRAARLVCELVISSGAHPRARTGRLRELARLVSSYAREPRAYRAIVRDELVPWLVGEADPLRERGRPMGWWARERA